VSVKIRSYYTELVIVYNLSANAALFRIVLRAERCNVCCIWHRCTQLLLIGDNALHFCTPKRSTIHTFRHCARLFCAHQCARRHWHS